MCWNASVYYVEKTKVDHYSRFQFNVQKGFQYVNRKVTINWYAIKRYAYSM